MSFGSNAIISKYIPDNNTYSQIGIFNNGNSQSIKVRGNLLNDDITITYNHITCSSGWGYSDITDIHSAFINSPSYIYNTKFHPNATTTQWNTISVPALKNFNKVYFNLAIGDVSNQNYFVDKRTDGNSSTGVYSGYLSSGWNGSVILNINFDSGTISFKVKSLTGWTVNNITIYNFWVHPMDHVA